MLRIKFNGWFQCRLATDPDPADEKRGVSGMMRVYPGEPDLDRVIHLQSSGFSRSHTPDIGVHVKQIYNENGVISDHFLEGAAVNLLGNPIFKGDNGIVAEDGKEPIVPFILEIKIGQIRLLGNAPSTDSFNKFPFPDLQAQALIYAPGFVACATNIIDSNGYLAARATLLEQDNLLELDEFEKEVNRLRIEFLRSSSASRFFDVYMPYQVPLIGEIYDDENRLGELSNQWSVDMWYGGWDPDGLCGFIEGFLNIG